MELAPRRRVLIAEDDPSVARAIARVVAPIAEPVVAGTVREGLRLLGEGEPCHTAILDYRLPDGSALDILTHAERSHLGLASLVLTGELDTRAEDEARARGAWFYLKPVGGELIERFLRDSEAPAEDDDEPPLSAASRLLTGMAHAAVADLHAQYEIGKFVHRLRYPAPGEAHDLKDLATLSVRLNLHPSALRRRARVSERIRAEEFEALIALRSPRALPLTWSHLELLSMVRSRTRREAIARQILAEDMGIRQCSALVKAASRERRRLGS